MVCFLNHMFRILYVSRRDRNTSQACKHCSPESFWHVRKVFAHRLYLRPTAAIFIQKFMKKNLVNLETFQMEWRISSLSGRFTVCLETFQIAWKVFQIVWKVSRLYGKFPGYLESFQFVWKV